jgi:predicted alpha/beta superfamily hydrolase
VRPAPALLLVLAYTAACGAGHPSDPTPDAGTPSDAGDSSPACGARVSAATDPAAYEALLGCLRSTEEAAAKTGAVRTFVELVEARGGFPIVDGNDVIFAYVRSADYDRDDDAHADEDFAIDRRNEPIRVAGEFDGWDPHALALQAEAADFHHLRVPIAAAAREGAGYKFIGGVAGGGDAYFSDPLSRRFLFDDFGRLSLVEGPRERGHLAWIPHVHAAKLNVDRDVYLYLPPAYDESADRFPVLYMHDGQNLFDAAMPNAAPSSWDADAVADQEIATGRARPFIIVGVPNDANRFGEYTWTPDTYDGGPAVGGDGADYADFLIHDLKPLVDARLRTKPGKGDTALLGSSLGGLISYEIGLAHPDVFHAIGGMSSTFQWGRMGLTNETVLERYAAATDLSTRGQIFYLDSGGNGGDCPRLDDGDDNFCETVTMRDTLVSKGISTFPIDPGAEHLAPADANILHWHEVGAVHNEAAWNARLFHVFRFFFRPE